MRIKPKLAAALVAVGIIGAGAAAATLSSSAALLPQYQAVKSGTAGYYAIGSDFRSINATVTPRAAAVNIGGVGTGGIGTQLCDPNNGFGLQLGLVSNGSTFAVEYAAGTLSGANADNCVGNGVLANPQLLNANLGFGRVAVNDDVQLYTSFTNYRTTVTVKHGKHTTHQKVWRGRATFQAIDLSSGFELYTKTVNGLAADWSLSSAGAGIQQDTTGMSACTPALPFNAVTPAYAPGTPFASMGSGVNYTGGSGACNDVVDFSNVFANGFDGIFGFGSGLARWNAEQVITTGGGLPANVAKVAPNDTLTPTGGPSESSFSVYAGQVL